MNNFFSKFTSCYFGSTITPAPETTTSQPPVTENLTESTRKIRSTTHWKPGLPAISEDDAPLEMKRNRNIERKVMSKMKSSTKTRWTTKERDPLISSSDEYRENCNIMALPAFSPTPFMF